MSFLSNIISFLLKWSSRNNSTRGIWFSPISSRILRIERCEDRRLLAITIDAFHDFTDLNDGETTLREAIEQANVGPGLDTINFASNLDDVPITLGKDAMGVPIAALSGLAGSLTYDDSVIITGCER